MRILGKNFTLKSLTAIFLSLVNDKKLLKLSLEKEKKILKLFELWKHLNALKALLNSTKLFKALFNV